MKNKKDVLMSSSLSYKTKIFSIKNEVLGGSGKRFSMSLDGNPSSSRIPSILDASFRNVMSKIAQ